MNEAFDWPSTELDPDQHDAHMFDWVQHHTQGMSEDQCIAWIMAHS